MKLVVCEGADDRAVIEALIRRDGLGPVRVEECGGVPSFNSYMRALNQRPEFTRREVESLGIVLDADESREACWQRIRDRVSESFRVDLQAEGSFAGERPRIGACIMGLGARGTLEDVVLESLRESQVPGFSCLDPYFRCLSEATGQPSYSAKARFRAWMASQPDYDFRVAKAAVAGYVPWDAPAFAGLRALLRGLG